MAWSHTVSRMYLHALQYNSQQLLYCVHNENENESWNLCYVHNGRSTDTLQSLKINKGCELYNLLECLIQTHLILL